MLSVIVPTYNEAQNMRRLIPGIRDALKGVPHEIIVVDDDSPDKTWKVAYGLGVRVNRRMGRRGLSSAVMEGFQMANGDVLAVMDADGQHDPALLPKLYAAVRSTPLPKGEVRLAIASRYLKGGSAADWRGYRKLGSRLATLVARLLCPLNVTDPLSGCFAIKRTTFESVRTTLRPKGFKILLEILANLPAGTPVIGLPLRFGLRQHGRSKLSLVVQFQFFAQVLSLLLRTSRGRFALFCMFFLAVAAVLILRLWNLRLLYTDSHIRTNMRTSIEDLSEEQGWLLSDINIVNVGHTEMRFIHRNHIRGKDPETCTILRFETSDLISCDAS